MQRGRALIILLAVLLVLVWVAVALWPQTQHYSEGRAAQVAHETWGAVCGGREPTVKTVNLPGDQRGEATAEYSDTPAGRVYTVCEIKLDPSVSSGEGPRACAVFVHEWGHLAGKGHSEDRDSVMYPVITKRNVPPKCR